MEHSVQRSRRGTRSRDRPTISQRGESGGVGEELEDWSIPQSACISVTSEHVSEQLCWGTVESNAEATDEMS